MKLIGGGRRRSAIEGTRNENSCLGFGKCYPAEAGICLRNIYAGEMGYTVGDSFTFRRCRVRSRIMNAVVAVNYFDESKGFWRFGYLVKADRKWAWVRPVVGRTVRVPVAQTREVEQAKK